MSKIRIDYHNDPQYVMIDGHWVKMPSKIEARWYQYLQVLDRGGYISDIVYQPGNEDGTGRPTFIFPETTQPVQYTPDFRATDLTHPKRTGSDKYIYYETKGMISSNALTKCRRLAEHYPDVRLQFIVMQLPKKTGIQYRRLCKIEKLCERIIVARLIFKQCGIK